MSNAHNRLQRMRSLFGDDAAQKQIAIVAVTASLAEFQHRVFTLGLDANGSPIGNYSNRPMYASKEAYRGLPNRFTPQGKNASGDFKNGNKRNSKYYKDGYAEFRSDVNRQNEKVDLNLTSTSSRSIKLGFDGDGAVFGFTDKERMDILIGNEERFGTEIFKATQKERDTASEAARKEIIKVINLR